MMSIMYVLQFDMFFEFKWPRASFPALEPEVKVFFIIW